MEQGRGRGRGGSVEEMGRKREVHMGGGRWGKYLGQRKKTTLTD